MKMQRPSALSPGLIVCLLALLAGSGAAVKAAAPVLDASPTAQPSPAMIAEAVTFSASATDADSDPLTYSWSIDDGFQATGASITHAFAVAGNYTAIVTVSDGTGGTTSGTVTVLVSDPGTGVPLPPTVTLQGTTILVSPNASGPAATGFRIHYNSRTDELRQYYRDSAAFSSSGGTLTVNISQLASYSAGPVVATAFNASGQSHYSALNAAASPRVAARSADYDVQPRFKAFVHGDITTQALTPVVNPLQLASIVINNLATDIFFQTSTEYHFDAGNIDGGIANIQAHLTAAQASPTTASVPLGQALHVVQDFYAHTNFVENWLAAHADTADNMNDADLVAQLPNLTGGDATLKDKVHSGYFEGVLALGGAFGTGGYSTYAVPASEFVTIYLDMETKAARPDGYKVGFVPWHGILNKDNDAQNEGKATVTGQSVNLFTWAKRFATVHTRKVYDDLNQATKDALSTAPAAPLPLADQVNNLLSGSSTTPLLAFGTSTTSLARGSTHAGLSAVSTLTVVLQKPAADERIRNGLSARAGLTVDVDTLGAMDAGLTGQLQLATSAQRAKGTLGKLTLKGNAGFAFSNVAAFPPYPGGSRPPYDASLRSASVQVTATVTTNGAITGTAHVIVKAGNGLPREVLVFAVSGQMAP